MICLQKRQDLKGMEKTKKLRSGYRSLPKGYYHLCTDGRGIGTLFHNSRQFAFIVNTLAIIAVKFDVVIYAYEIMPNHIHLLVSCTGNTCVDIFEYLCRRISKMLKDSGYDDLPDNYCFRLVPITTVASMRSHYVYIARNPYEKGFCMPCGYLWGSGYLAYNWLSGQIHGRKVSDYSVRELSRELNSKVQLPPDWEMHPVLGVLPQFFVNTKKFHEVFPNVKLWFTMLIKDYESCAHISDSLGEEMILSDVEAKDIVNGIVNKEFHKDSVNALSETERYRIALKLSTVYHMPTKTISYYLNLSERVVIQSLKSKDYGTTV